ncbi:hypothetical protein HBA55_08815 [Pseudomaricurvus alkylphenolicus]|jgi:hypothetical protein|uniref:hypothetical protein n=1 Tax=Pseudomaricurvus alkylphenolicus TaxID=1306991 RepID=UPI00141E9AAF|nr:hypothetical protein [Pseudomaricurvus alkylphenolicus]NIB39685.1 hypothetical protein [Pseudomaricurvus alkylphenolicus]
MQKQFEGHLIKPIQRELTNIMPYVIRNRQGQITALLKEPALGLEEHLDSAHEDIVEFLNEKKEDSPEKALASSDRDIARVTEDLVNLLIAKNLILFTELPEAVQRKLLNREKLRSSLQGAIENFLDDDDAI